MNKQDQAVTGFVVHELAAEVRVRVVRAMPPLPADLDQRIEALWQIAANRVASGGAGRLFNGRIFSVDNITRIGPSCIEITGHMTEFRRLVAQVENHALFDALRIRSLAVCGVLRCAGGVVIGRRPPAALYQPGMWQLSPAGSVDAGALAADGTADLGRQILTELWEEVGIKAEHVTDPQPLCIVEHPGSHVCDLGMAISTSLDAAEVLAAHKARGNGEYDPLRVVPDTDLKAFVALVGLALVPPALEFLVRARLLPACYALAGRGCAMPLIG